MMVNELIEVLKKFDGNMEVVIQHFNGDDYGFALPNLDSFNKDDVKADGDTVILDISNK
jgi:hypothetical protein